MPPIEIFCVRVSGIHARLPSAHRNVMTISVNASVNASVPSKIHEKGLNCVGGVALKAIIIGSPRKTADKAMMGRARAPKTPNGRPINVP